LESELCSIIARASETELGTRQEESRQNIPEYIKFSVSWWQVIMFCVKSLHAKNSVNTVTARNKAIRTTEWLNIAAMGTNAFLCVVLSLRFLVQIFCGALPTSGPRSPAYYEVSRSNADTRDPRHQTAAELCLSLARTALQNLLDY